MLALAFTFPAGRYHATPWDRHVNEGAVAWPPEPWRILRALIATWHHKLKHDGRHSEATLEGLIETLAAELPEYALPAASHSHTRHYMPQFAADKTSLIFDAFTAIDRAEPLGVVWPNVLLPDEQRLLLDDLLAVMGYLGRAESWVEAQRIDTAPDANGFYPDSADTFTKAHTEPEECPCRSASITALSTSGSSSSSSGDHSRAADKSPWRSESTRTC